MYIYNVYINLLYLPLFKFVYLFFLSFFFLLSFPLNIFVSFIFIALFPNWHFSLVLFSSLCFSQFCSGRHNFWFPLFNRSIYYTLFLLDCFDFAYGCIYICVCVYSVTLFTVAIQVFICIEFLQFCEGFLIFFFLVLLSFFFFSLFYNFNLIFLNPLYFFYLISFVCLSYCSFPLEVNL